MRAQKTQKKKAIKIERTTYFKEKEINKTYRSVHLTDDCYHKFEIPSGFSGSA